MFKKKLMASGIMDTINNFLWNAVGSFLKTQFKPKKGGVRKSVSANHWTKKVKKIQREGGLTYKQALQVYKQK